LPKKARKGKVFCLTKHNTTCSDDMAKGKSPYIREIHGGTSTLGMRTRRNGTIEISAELGKRYTRTEAQDEIREKYGHAVELWRAKSAEEKAEYDALGAPEHITGWNYFMREQMAITGPPFLDGWSARAIVTLTEAGGGAYENHPTVIDIPYREGMKTDFADIRFTEADGATLIPFGRISKTDGVTARFCIVRSFTAGEVKMVYAYWNNASAAAAHVDHTAWVNAWYNAHNYGNSYNAYSNENCSVYPRTPINAQVIPAWAGHVYGAVDFAGGKSGAWYGRAQINGVHVPWNASNQCGTYIGDQWDVYGKVHMLKAHADIPAWRKGEPNTVKVGHSDGGNQGYRVIWTGNVLAAVGETETA